jgi:hypothetical protein
MSGAIIRFRFMAIFAGAMSLLLWFAYMPAKYLVIYLDSNCSWIHLSSLFAGNLATLFHEAKIFNQHRLVHVGWHLTDRLHLG